MHYNETIPIKPHKSTAWLAEFTNGNKHLLVFHENATVEDVVRFVNCHNHNSDFNINAIESGTFTIAQVTAYLSNGHMINQDMEVIIA